MRRADRAVTDPEQVRQMLEECRVCRLGLWDGREVYIVPMNYGYTFEDGRMTLYFHCAQEGRRKEILEKNPAVSFELDQFGGYTGQGDLPCVYGCRYASVMGTGTARFLETVPEKIRGLEIFMRHVAGRDFSFTEEMTKRVGVLMVTADTYSCKELKEEG